MADKPSADALSKKLFYHDGRSGALHRRCLRLRALKELNK